MRPHHKVSCNQPIKGEDLRHLLECKLYKNRLIFASPSKLRRSELDAATVPVEPIDKVRLCRDSR